MWRTPEAICCRFWMRFAVFGFGLVHFLLEPACSAETLKTYASRCLSL